MFDRRFAAAGGPSDCHHVESRGIFQQVVLAEIGDGQASKAALLWHIDCIARMSSVLGLPRFYFDEHDSSPLDGHQVDFTELPSAAASNDLASVPPQPPGGERFAAFAKRAAAREPPGKVEQPMVPSGNHESGSGGLLTA